MHDMTRLSGKTAVITGGATGIGFAAAKRFIEEGALVFIFGRRQDALDAAVAELGPNARAVKGSVSDEADLDRLYAAVKAERGTLDIVFANAGVGSQLRLGEITSGIGRATAKRFVDEGAHVVITGRREKELKEAAAFLKVNVTTVVGDVSRLEDLDRLYAVVKEKHGHIDILFANAGAGTIGPLAVATEAHFDQTFDVNVKGLFFTVQKALPLFKDRGSIILNSSVSNVLGVPGFSAYAASKAAVRNFSRAWTLELKDRKIRVNTMSPGPIETPALETTTGLTPEQAEQAAAQFASQIPMGRRGKPEEIAAAVTFLASDESSFITGVDLAVDGGMAQV
jgi:NAD(P)-dependent dehydrogenase (short-subunit alcohol dehydrogenase family)